MCDVHAGGADADVDGCGSEGSADVAGVAAAVCCCHCGGCDCCCHFDGAVVVAAVCLRVLYRFCHPDFRHPSACWANGTHRIRWSCWSVDVAAADAAAAPIAIVFAAVAGSSVVVGGDADVAAAVACGSDNIDDVQLHWQWLADETCCFFVFFYFLFFGGEKRNTHIKLVCGQHPVKSLSPQGYSIWWTWVVVCLCGWL